MKCNIQEPMHIHSLGGELREATIVERIGGKLHLPLLEKEVTQWVAATGL